MPNPLHAVGITFIMQPPAEDMDHDWPHYSPYITQVDILLPLTERVLYISSYVFKKTGFLHPSYSLRVTAVKLFPKFPWFTLYIYACSGVRRRLSFQLYWVTIRHSKSDRLVGMLNTRQERHNKNLACPMCHI